MGNEKILNRSYAMALILAVLKDGPTHGYNILQEIERRSDSSVSFQDGTLYPLLRSLEDAELIEGAWEHPKGERKRRVYKLKEKGAKELASQIARWQEFSQGINKILGGEPA